MSDQTQLQYGQGIVLQTQVDSPKYQNKKFGDVDFVDCVTVYNDEADELVIFAVNKDLKDSNTLSMDLRQFADYRILEHLVLHDEDLYAVNTEADPNRIAPVTSADSKIQDGKLTATLKHKSWNMIRLGRA